MWIRLNGLCVLRKILGPFPKRIRGSLDVEGKEVMSLAGSNKMVVDGDFGLFGMLADEEDIALTQRIELAGEGDGPIDDGESCGKV